MQSISSTYRADILSLVFSGSIFVNSGKGIDLLPTKKKTVFSKITIPILSLGSIRRYDTTYLF